MNRRDLQGLTKVRLAEARALLDAGCPDGAYYLAGYAVECALKSCIAKETKRHDFPDKKLADLSYTHSFKELVKTAKLRDELNLRKSADLMFRENWDEVQFWSEQSRYRRHSAKDARDLIEAIRERRYGVLAWIKLNW
jgi:HEPN domain-containing protein